MHECVTMMNYLRHGRKSFNRNSASTGSCWKLDVPVRDTPTDRILFLNLISAVIVSLAMKAQKRFQQYHMVEEAMASVLLSLLCGQEGQCACLMRALPMRVSD